GPWGGGEPRLRAVFALQAPLHDLELQGADGREEGGAGRCVAGVERLDYAFLQELFETGAILLRVRRTRIRDIGEHLGREPRNLVVQDRLVLRERVADSEFAVADQ